MGFVSPVFSGFLKTFTSAPSFLVCWAEKGRNWRENSASCFSPLQAVPRWTWDQQPSVLLRLCSQVSEICSPSLWEEKIAQVLWKHNLFLLQVLQPESTMWAQRHLQVVVENAALGGIPSPVLGWVVGSMKK